MPDTEIDLMLSADDIAFLDGLTSGEWVMTERGRERLARIVKELKRFIHAVP